MNKRTCAVEGCEQPAQTRGWCGMHYARWRRNGNPEKSKHTHRLSEVDATTRTGVCAHCGPGVRIQKNGEGGWRCTPGTRGRHRRPHWLRAKIAAEQGNCCAICAKPLGADACLDHCHVTGVLRGVLCRHCNYGLGYFKDEPKRLAAAISYLQRQGGPPA